MSHRLAFAALVLALLVPLVSFCLAGRREEDDLAAEPKLVPLEEESAETIEWTEAMSLAVTQGDPEVGYAAERHLQGISYDDVRLLSLFMTAMWRPGWAPEWQSAAGEVIINRMASEAFPGRTVREVLFSPEGAADFPVIRTAGWDELAPDRGTVRRAMALLRGDSVLEDPDVVYIGQTAKAWGYAWALPDSAGGCTYICRAEPQGARR